MKIFCKRLKELRKEKGLSLTQLADIINVSHSTILRWESEQIIPSI